MKTAMQELIEELIKESKSSDDNTALVYASICAKINFKYIEKEKEQIIDFAIGAYQDISRMKGVSENLISENKILFEEYYNQTYNQNK